MTNKVTVFFIVSFRRGAAITACLYQPAGGDRNFLFVITTIADLSMISIFYALFRDVQRVYMAGYSGIAPK
jgi:hypothetical protein